MSLGMRATCKSSQNRSTRVTFDIPEALEELPTIGDDLHLEDADYASEDQLFLGLRDLILKQLHSAEVSLANYHRRYIC